MDNGHFMQSVVFLLPLIILILTGCIRAWKNMDILQGEAYLLKASLFWHYFYL